MKIHNYKELVIYFSFVSSWWIANLGVVPLLILAAFLFAPILTFFLDLLFLVTRVLDTIFILPIEYISKKLLIFYFSKHKLLLKLSPSVKGLLGVFIIFQQITSVAHSAVSPMKAQDILLAKGQIFEITGIKLDHYTIGNKEVLTHRFSSKESKIIIKGKMLGFSEIVIWKKSKRIALYKIYVFSKREQLSLLSMASGLKSIGLSIIIKGKFIIVRGTLSDIETFKLYRKMLLPNSQRIINHVTLSQKVQNMIIGEVYFYFYNEYIDEIQCKKLSYSIHCYYPSHSKIDKSALKRLRSEFGVKFFVLNSQGAPTNYKLKFKIIQIEKLNGEELNFGLDKLSANLGEIMQFGLLGAIKKNEINLRSIGIDMSTLAEPTALIGLNTPLIIKVGDDIPYQSESENKVFKTMWKFAGLEIKVLLKKRGKSFILDYHTKLKMPGRSKSISGSEEKSSVYISQNTPTEIFSIGYRTTKSTKGGFPFLSKIPILGKLFTSHSEGITYKKITGIISLEKVD